MENEMLSQPPSIESNSSEAQIWGSRAELLPILYPKALFNLQIHGQNEQLLLF